MGFVQGMRKHRMNLGFQVPLDIRPQACRSKRHNDISMPFGVSLYSLE